MATKSVVVRACDRCAKVTPATDTVPICYGETTYVLDLCDKHSEQMDLELRGWLRLGRENSVQHHRTWVPGELSQRKAPRPTRTPVPADKSAAPAVPAAQSRPAPTPASSASVSSPAAPPAPPQPATPVPGSDLDDLDDVEESTLLPTQSLLDDLAKLDLQWADVVRAVDTAFALTPARRPDVTCYLTEDLSVLVADDGSVLGVARREPTDPLPQTADIDRKRITRKGKRGGQGRIGPRTMPEIVAAVRAAGWDVDDSRRHIAVTGPNGQRSTIPKSTSDHRAALNCLSELRKLGLDLRVQAS